MAISGVTQSVAAVSAYDNQAQAGGDAQNNSLITLQRKDTAAQTQLSASGKMKSSLADLQAKAQALRNFSKPPAFQELSVVVSGFVQSFNNLGKTVNEGFSQRQNALNGDSGSGQAFNEIRKAMAGSGSSPSGTLQNLGIDHNNDGHLTLDQNMLQKQFQSDQVGSLTTLSNMADRVGKTIDRQLSMTSSGGNRAQNGSVRVFDQASIGSVAQDRLDTHKNYQQRLASQLANAGGYVARNAVVSYFNVASL